MFNFLSDAPCTACVCALARNQHQRIYWQQKLGRLHRAFDEH